MSDVAELFSENTRRVKLFSPINVLLTPISSQCYYFYTRPVPVEDWFSNYVNFALFSVYLYVFYVLATGAVEDREQISG